MIKEAFGILTLSKIKYCGELCFDNNLKALNNLLVQFYERTKDFHLKIRTQMYSIIGEFVKKSIEYHFFTR